MRYEFTSGGMVLALLLAAPAPALAQSGKAPSKTPPAVTVAKPDTKPAVPFDVTVARRTTTDEIKKWMEEGVAIRFIDTRSSFTGDKIKGAEQVPDAKLAEWSKDLAKDTLIVAYCT